jgi:hypothetical protein
MPAIKKPNEHFDAPIWTGVSTSSAITISSLNFQPDLVWGKNRTSGYTHGIHDSVRGTAAGRLQSNASAAEVAPGSFAYGSVSAFNSNGFTASPGSSTNENWNETSSNFVAWCWKAGGTAVTNTAGSITSQVSANPTAGFSVVTYTGTGANATVGHGLGVEPEFIIVKERTADRSWNVYAKALGSATKFFLLEQTTDAQTDATKWNSTAANTSVFSVGSAVGTNNITGPFVAYCWAPIAGYSAFGSYTGNGSTTNDGPFVYLGFRPKFILGRRTDSTGGSWMFDTSRNTSNLADDYFYANSPDGEFTNITTLNIDILSNGFKVRSGTSPSAYINASSGTYIYMAFAESPFKFSNAR